MTTDTFDQNALQSFEYYHHEGPVHRSAKSPNELVPAPAGANTIYLKVRQTFENPKLDHLPSMGTRVQKSDGTFGRFQWKTFKQVKNLTQHFASGLNALGMTPVCCGFGL